jgi:hypothetical protein
MKRKVTKKRPIPGVKARPYKKTAPRRRTDPGTVRG